MGMISVVPCDKWMAHLTYLWKCILWYILLQSFSEAKRGVAHRGPVITHYIVTWDKQSHLSVRYRIACV